MDRRLLVSWLLLPIASAGCAGQPHGQGADTPSLIERDNIEQMARRRQQAPSPEAAFALRKLGHVDEAGKVLTGGYYDSARLERLEAELKKVGARLGADGKIYDRNGREVYVSEDKPSPGCRMLEESLRALADARQEELRKLRQQYTVVLLPYFGLQPP
jgi:hypothetical protein